MKNINCIFCKHWNFDPGSYSYSEVSPGSDFNMYCGRSHYDVDCDDCPNEGDFKKYILRDCVDYEPVKMEGVNNE